jgi:FkbM family methyltransferase
MFELKFKYIEQTKCIKNPNEEYLSSFFNFTDEETYVNCGCYDGKSLLYFYQYVNKKCSKLIGIDCVKKNISDAVDTMIKNNIPKEKYEILYNALGEKEETIFVKEEGMYNINEIDIKKGYQVKQVTLDTLFEDKPYTFLSLDVEGFEMGVLRGSEKIIRETKPKLAISAYHKYEDIIEIILYLHKINPGYKFSFMGEYINTFADLTLYCK